MGRTRWLWITFHKISNPRLSHFQWFWAHFLCIRKYKETKDWSVKIWIATLKADPVDDWTMPEPFKFKIEAMMGGNEQFGQSFTVYKQNSHNGAIFNVQLLQLISSMAEKEEWHLLSIQSIQWLWFLWYFTPPAQRRNAVQQRGQIHLQHSQSCISNPISECKCGLWPFMSSSTHS